MAQKIVLFGAGPPAAGTWPAGVAGGLDMVFVDRDASLVESLKQAGSYRVDLHGESYREVSVTGFRVHPSEARQAVAGEIVEAALVLTAVFDPNLPDVARTLALAVGACRQAGRTVPLNCIACENMMDSSSVLGRHVRTLLTGKTGPTATARRLSRLHDQPRGAASADPRVIVAEDYNEWTCRADAFKGTKPAGLTALELVDNQSARLERKLFVHNGGHAACGYFGFHRGRTYIHEAVADPVVAEHVLGVLDEIGDVVRRKHAFSPSPSMPTKRTCAAGARWRR